MMAGLFFYRSSMARLSKFHDFVNSGPPKRFFVIWSPLRQQIKQDQPRPNIRPSPNIAVDQAELLRVLREKRRPKLRNTTNFQISDGLNASEWTLIYRNTTNAWLFMMVGMYSIVCTVCMAVAVQEMDSRIKKLRSSDQALTIKSIVSRKAAVYLLFSAAVYVTLIRFRRCWVVRIYEKNLTTTGKPPAPIVVESGAKPPKTPPPVREYCIVWVNWLFRRRLFYYKSDQTDRVLELAPLFTNIVGNFRARNRPWAVFQHYFEDSLDYYRVRGKTVGGNVYVA